MFFAIFCCVDILDRILSRLPKTLDLEDFFLQPPADDWLVFDFPGVLYPILRKGISHLEASETVLFLTENSVMFVDINLFRVLERKFRKSTKIREEKRKERGEGFLEMEYDDVNTRLSEHHSIFNYFPISINTKNPLS